jgi:nucleotide-binding universal stress UspA family protein
VATIVVGVDGSASAQEALHFAVEEAKLRGAGVRAVMAIDIATMAYGPTSGFGPDGPRTRSDGVGRKIAGRIGPSRRRAG